MIDGESSKADDSESVDLEIWLQLFWRLRHEEIERETSNTDPSELEKCMHLIRQSIFKELMN